MSVLLIGIIIAIVLVLVYFFVLRTSEPTPWKCYTGINTPLRKNAAGDVECMAVNGKDCLWSKEDCEKNLSKPVESVKPLTCGEIHKSFYGSPGYDNPEHWCSKGKLLI